jgi:hypothetical protein
LLSGVDQQGSRRCGVLRKPRASGRHRAAALALAREDLLARRGRCLAYLLRANAIRRAQTNMSAGTLELRVPDALVQAIAERVADLLRCEPTRSRLVDAQTLADALGVDRSYVYSHADELGAVRIGSGSKPRLRFDLDTARKAFACYASNQSQGSNASAGAESAGLPARRRRGLPNRLPEPGSVLAVRPRSPAGPPTSGPGCSPSAEAMP